MKFSKICYGLSIFLLIANSVFWFGYAYEMRDYVFSSGQRGNILALLFMINGLIYAIFFFGFYKKIKWLFISSLPYIAANMITSIMDEGGPMDFLMFGVNLILLFTAAFSGRFISAKKKDDVPDGMY
ncbi:MAG: hypothetical protein PHX54_11250 [Lentimicrobiaceae bacterium]|nr:hypothetical protein [Lentimicrobiaceae bacterium]